LIGIQWPYAEIHSPSNGVPFYKSLGYNECLSNPENWWQGMACILWKAYKRFVELLYPVVLPIFE